MEKLPIFDQNHGITRFEKSQFVDFFNFLFLKSGKDFFLSRIYILKHIFMAYFGYDKKMEKLPSFDQNCGLTPLEKSQFFDIFNFLFL